MYKISLKRVNYAIFILVAVSLMVLYATHVYAENPNPPSGDYLYCVDQYWCRCNISDTKFIDAYCGAKCTNPGVECTKMAPRCFCEQAILLMEPEIQP